MFQNVKTVLCNESGASLILALVTSSILFILIGIVVHFTDTDMRTAKKQDRQVSAYYMAEAGIERALQDLNQSLTTGSAMGTNFQDPNFYGGSYSVHVTPKTNDHNENVGYLLESTGIYQGEQRTVTDLVKQPIWPGNGVQPQALQFALYGEQNVSIHTIPGLLGVGSIPTHPIQIDGNAHANQSLILKHDSLIGSPPPPVVNGMLSSTDLSYIQAPGVDPEKMQVRGFIPIPQFDFDQAREVAKKNGIYVPGDVSYVSLLGLAPGDGKNIIFIDGNLYIAGADLLGISLQNRTIIVNGNIYGDLAGLGGSIVTTTLNLIAKENIQFTGVLTGLQVNGILFAQGMNPITNQPDPTMGEIKVEGHAEVIGYTGGQTIDMGASIVSTLSGLITGSMHFQYDSTKFASLPKDVGFKQNQFQVVAQGGS